MSRLTSLRPLREIRLARSTALAVVAIGLVVGHMGIAYANERGPRPEAAASESPAKPSQPKRRDALNLRGTVLGFKRPKLAYRDKLATLEAVQVALSEVEDGTNYVWYRPHGQLSGVIRPIRSFADTQGRICRSIRVMLRAGIMTRTVQGDACRDHAGRWSLERAQ